MSVTLSMFMVAMVVAGKFYPIQVKEVKLSKNVATELLGSNSKKKESPFSNDAALIRELAKKASLGSQYTTPAPIDHGDATRTRVKNAPAKARGGDNRSKYLKRRDKKLNARISEWQKIPDAMKGGFTRPGSNN
jgi:hypothetical protein